MAFLEFLARVSPSQVDDTRFYGLRHVLTAECVFTKESVRHAHGQKSQHCSFIRCGHLGASYPLARVAVQDMAPSAFVLGRFLLATLLLFPLALGGLRDARAARVGTVLGLVEGAVCLLLALNIGHMPASRCAFIMGASVVIVPLWAALFRLQKMTLFTLLRAFISLVGLYFLTGTPLGSMRLPDLWVLLAAALWALDIVLLKKQTLHFRPKPQVIAFYQTATTCLVPLALLLHEAPQVGGLMVFSWRSMAALLFCAVFATVLNLMLQIKYQRYTSAAHAALRLSLEPLIATWLAVWFFDDAITKGMMAGGGLMMFAIVLPELQRVGGFCLDSLRAWTA